MSEDFLSRWSRRKRQTELDHAEADAADVRRDADPVTPAEEVGPVGPTPPAEPTLDLLKDLPPIEAITAATDIRPFLAPGVPVDIARAALRRAWSADPEIRNFIGLADYDWDFHTPGAIPGFGPLEMTEELRSAVARVLGATTDHGPEPAPVRDVGGLAEEISHDIKQPIAAPADTAETLGPKPLPTTFALPARVDVAVQHEIRRNDQSAPSMVRRGHGRALPK